EVPDFKLVARWRERDVRLTAVHRVRLAVLVERDFDAVPKLRAAIGITALSAKLHREDDLAVLRGLNMTAGRVLQNAVLVLALGDCAGGRRRLPGAQGDDDDRHKNDDEDRNREAGAFLPGHLFEVTSYQLPVASFQFDHGTDSAGNGFSRTGNWR